MATCHSLLRSRSSPACIYYPQPSIDTVQTCLSVRVCFVPHANDNIQRRRYGREFHDHSQGARYQHQYHHEPMNQRNYQSLKGKWCLLILLFLSEVHDFAVHRKRDVSETSSSWPSLLHVISINREDDPVEHDPTELSSQSSHGQFSFSDYDPRRRNLLLQSTLVSILLQCFPSVPASSEAADQNHKSISPWKDRGIFDDRTFLESLTYDKVLGRGSFKTVYKVRSNAKALALSNLVADVDNSQGKNTGRSSSSSSMPMSLQFAMSVEPLRTKSQTKEALRAIEIVQFLQEKTKQEDDQVDNDNFEQLYTWWIQKSNLSEFSRGRRIFSQTDLDQTTTRQTQKTSK